MDEFMEKHRLRIVSYNIHKGFSTGNRRFVLNKIREALREIQPDLVFLQEVLGHHEGHSKKVKDWPDQPQFEFLADQLWPHFAYGKNAIYTAGHHGNAILSKYPFHFYENIDISTNMVERRGLLHGTIDVPGRKKPLHAICIHLGLLEAERFQQVLQLCSRIESHVPHDEPLLIGGDFNDWRGRVSSTLEEKLEVNEVFRVVHGYHAKTFPSWLPALRLDRIYYRGLVARNAQCLNGKPWNELSDHTALVAELAV
jgi:endonuclease/exonuclease/phosphatase family metal-dependent hydrolase